MAYSKVIRRQPLDVPSRCQFHDILFDSPAQRARFAPFSPQPCAAIALVGAACAAAIALVAYLLWPTWEPEASSDPARLPVSIGATLFNVPTTAVRMKIQRHTGPQERVDPKLCVSFTRGA